MLFKKKASSSRKVDNETKSMNVSLTEQESLMEEGTTLVTRTDLKGRITYANSNFASISEIPAQDLIGKPHSIIRHPDMPRSAFYDMWDTLKKGKPWKGMVKNRASSGNHYWVDANVAPRVENGETIGYISIRRKPSREMVSGAENLYKNVRDGKAKFPYSDGKRLGIRIRFYAVIAFTLVAIASAPVLECMGFSRPVFQLTSLVMGIISAVLGFTLMNQILVPLAHATRMGHQIAQGDLRVSVQHNRNDEIGELFKSILNLLINTAGVIAEISETSDVLKESSGVLNSASQSFAAGSEETSIQSETIAKAASKMNENLQSLAASMEEMSISISEVAKSASEASRVAQDSMDDARRADEVVKILGQNADEIGKVVESIAAIADQTNLLALNASIEAAGAGDAGKGFAVVAAEVKELARQSRESSDAVKNRVEGVRNSVQDTMKAMKTMLGTFETIRNLSAGIASSVEEQSISSKEIAEGISRSSAAASEVTENIQGISKTSREGAKNASEAMTMAQNIDEVVQKLRVVVKGFSV